MKETIGERIKKLRTYRKLTQEEVGKIIGASKQTLHKYENGIITNIPLDKIEALANLFDVSPSYIMGWDSKETIVYKHQEYEQKILFPYNKLSNEGKEKVITYTQDLVDSGKYSIDQTLSRATQTEIDREVEAYRKELELQARMTKSSQSDTTKEPKNKQA